MQNFYQNQNPTEQEFYIKILTIVASLSNLFADSENPFLHYRVMENAFCKAFNANNFSRSDISIDAGKYNVGLGLKTFLQANGSTFQKVAEFNREAYLFKFLDDENQVLKIATMRNERIKSTKRICNIDSVIYHLLTRAKNKMFIFEENMNLIDIDNIVITKNTNSSIQFNDKKNEYSFNKSKSTLLKKFHTELDKCLVSFPITILKDPFEFLLQLKVNFDINTQKQQEQKDFIVLPLYSPGSKKVEEKSGLNQWNASGRPRDPDEVYIPVPSWIHKYKKDFFKYNTTDNKTDSFNVILPNKKIIRMRLAQAGGKALMSDPNKALGTWILRDVLNIKERTLVTKEMLNVIGIDSIKLTKENNTTYSLDFLKSNSFELFKNKIKGK